MKLPRPSGKHYANAMERNLRWQDEITGRRVARQIRGAAAGRIWHLALIAAAAFAEEYAAGRVPDIEPPPPCSPAALAAEAKMAGPLQ